MESCLRREEQEERENRTRGLMNKQMNKLQEREDQERAQQKYREDMEIIQREKRVI